MSLNVHKNEKGFLSLENRYRGRSHRLAFTSGLFPELAVLELAVLNETVRLLIQNPNYSDDTKDL